MNYVNINSMSLNHFVNIHGEETYKPLTTKVSQTDTLVALIVHGSKTVMALVPNVNDRIRIIERGLETRWFIVSKNSLSENSSIPLCHHLN